MKMYNNGQRKGMMYGGGATPRKPMMYGGMATKKKMQMGGLAEQNRKKNTAQAPAMNPMGDMTEQKRFSMGIKKGGKLSAGLAALKKERPDVVKKMGFKKGGRT